jgi:hypothetical protein
MEADAPAFPKGRGGWSGQRDGSTAKRGWRLAQIRVKIQYFLNRFNAKNIFY